MLASASGLLVASVGLLVLETLAWLVTDVEEERG